MADEQITNAAGAWDDFVADEISDEQSKRDYLVALAKVQATTELASAFERARDAQDLPKAEVARRVGTQASAISRLFSGDGINPTVGTMTEMAFALGLHIKVVVEDSNGGDAPPLEVVANF